MTAKEETQTIMRTMKSKFPLLKSIQQVTIITKQVSIRLTIANKQFNVIILGIEQDKLIAKNKIQNKNKWT
ncbi:hypothetical protein TTHERM_00035260 (macronuclear) [Tetrahymena thermophila SB210]|uniref:Uncharacterized protein n=1 Tax=Tetrahymena thermophila (strain SB210) TaxID=312017 RepID=Q22MJ4_TETTS|nr:hypothetical protein TTHERM_00035260 [Tetrahymena thermophila SB210]EAR86376.2 hypothetical protein TTHERM_00035260 [Tetrahymena thermophila SB210]|eukprot:XP_977026.2 hypothetical protein TTHERM_00035260 [Tetrahymena thermophila SB210]